MNNCIALSDETVFEMLLLKSLTLDIMYKHASYSNFSNALNALFCNEKEENNRNILQHRRLCEAWLYYNLLVFIKEYFGNLLDFNAPYIQDLDMEIRRLNKDFYFHFMNKWMNHIDKKICKHPKCSIALYIDGDHKITRLTCLHKNNLKKSDEFDKEAFHSCPETPAPNSFFCHLHVNIEYNLPFEIDGETIFINVKDIKPTCTDKLKHVEIDKVKIHDTFLDEKDRLLYLLTYNKKIFWLEESRIPIDVLNNFLLLWKNSYVSESSESCNIRKDIDSDIPCKNKTRTKGVLLAVYNCGIIGSYKEIFNDESLLQVSLFLLDFLNYIPNFIIYDDACHLHPFMEKHNKLKDERLKKFETLKFTIDRLHIHNHTRPICKEYSSEKHTELVDINSVVCEETNYWFGGYKHIMKHMNYVRFNFYLYIIFNCYNLEKIKLNKIKKY